MRSKVVFDIFGVLITSGFHSAATKLSQMLRLPVNTIKPIYERWEVPFDLGNISQKDFWKHVLEDLHVDADWKFLNKAVLESYKPIIDSIDLLKRVSAVTDTYLLSNTRKEWFEFVDASYNLTNYVKKAFLSYQLSLRKPDTKIFELVLSDLACSADEVIFIDDEADNVRVARTMGISCIHFQNSHNAEKQLKKLLNYRQ